MDRANDELSQWFMKGLQNLLRAEMEPSIITEYGNHFLQIKNPDQARDELNSFIGTEIDDYSQPSLLLRKQKLEFIDTFMQKRFSQKKKKQKPVKVEFSKKNIDKIQKELSGPAFSSKKTCYCMARDHELIGNCLNCGKIVCAIEGRGPCTFCSSPISIRGEILAPASASDKNLKKAISHKNKLVEYDKNTEERLGVIDDQNDWYDISNNVWLSNEEREKARLMNELQLKKTEEAKNLIQISVDFETNKVSMDVGGKKIIEQQEKENKAKADAFFSRAAKKIPANTCLNDQSRLIYESIMTKLKNDFPKQASFSTNPRPEVAVVQHENPFSLLE